MQNINKTKLLLILRYLLRLFLFILIVSLLRYGIKILFRTNNSKNDNIESEVSAQNYLISKIKYDQISEKDREALIKNKDLSKLGLSENEIEEFLRITASEINKKMPIMADSVTRCDGVVALNDRQIMYKCTLLNVSKENMDTVFFNTNLIKMKAIMIYSIHSQPLMENLRNFKVIFIYNYSDMFGKFLGDLKITPEEYNHPEIYTFFTSLKDNKYITGLPEKFSEFISAIKDSSKLKLLYFSLRQNPNVTRETKIPSSYREFLSIYKFSTIQ